METNKTINFKESWQQFIPLVESSVEESAICYKNIVNGNFVEQFALELLNIDEWFQTAGRSYELMDEHG